MIGRLMRASGSFSPNASSESSGLAYSKSVVASEPCWSGLWGAASSPRATTWVST